MKKLLAVSALLALSTASFAADDKGTEFKFGGEIRERYNYNYNPTFLNSNGTVEQHVDQRSKFGVTAITSDKFQGYLGLLHTTRWGGAAAVPSTAGPQGANSTTALGTSSTTGVTPQNALQVNEAWLWWKVSDMFTIKTGRQELNYGDGFLISRNDWDTNPDNYDALIGRFSWDFLDLDVGGGKHKDAGITATTPATIANPVNTTGATNTDNEINWYLLYGSVKNMPDAIKTVELGVLQVFGDSGTTGVYSGTSATGGAWSVTNVDLHLKGEFAIVDYRAEAVFQTGKQKNGAAANQDLTLGGNMYDISLGLNFPEFMKGRAYVGYHMDTGNDGTDATKNTTYSPLFYDTHQTGRSNFWMWGNFTDIYVGLTLQPSEDSWAGLEVNLASRTNEKQAPNHLGSGSSGNFLAPTLASATSTSGNSEKNLGTEVDVWFKHNYGHGFSMLGQVGYIMLGNYYKPATESVTTATGTATGAPSLGNAWQFLAQAQYNF